MGTGLANLLWFRGIGKLSPAAVSYLGLLSPVVATLIGFVWLNQSLTVIQLLGILIIFVSVLLGQRINSPRPRQAPDPAQEASLPCPSSR